MCEADVGGSPLPEVAQQEASLSAARLAPFFFRLIQPSIGITQSMGMAPLREIC